MSGARRRDGFHGYRTFTLAVLVLVVYAAGYAYGQAEAVVGGVPGLLVGLAALVGANEAAAAYRARGGTPTIHAETAEVSAEGDTHVEGSPVHVHHDGA